MQQALTEAAASEAKYDWIAAAELYQRALGEADTENDTLGSASIAGLLARSYFKASFQSETHEEFRNRVRQAEAFYQTASQLYEKAGREAQSEKSKASSIFASFWQKDTAAERRNLLEKCIALAKNAAQTLEEQGEKRLLAETRQELSTYLLEMALLATEREARNNYCEIAAHASAKAAEAFEALYDKENQLICLDQAVEGLLGYRVPEYHEFHEFLSRAETLSSQMEGIAERLKTPYATALLQRSAATVIYFQGDRRRALELSKSGVLSAEETKDNYLIGLVLLGGVSAAYLGAVAEDLEQSKELANEGLALVPRALKCMEAIAAYQWIPNVILANAGLLTNLAAFGETETERKRVHLRKAIEVATKGRSWEGWPHYRLTVEYHLSRTQYFLALITPDLHEKARLLESALPSSEAAVRESDTLGSSWFRGVTRNYLALVKAELSSLSQDSKVKMELLQSAILDMQQCVDVCSKSAVDSELMAILARFEEWYGDILVQLHRLSKEPRNAQDAVRVYEDAIAYLKESGHTAPIGSVRWKAATAYDSIGDHRAASDAFRQAAEDYRLGAKKIPSSESVFAELASYMEAWSLIEEARLHHDQDQFLSGAENYSKAAEILRGTKTWSHLSKHYAGCSYLEGGEALSRQERPEAALESFTSAINAFQEARRELEEKRSRTNIPQESDELRVWLDITGVREKLSRARIMLEEAKVLDMQGEEEASAAKYRSASKAFEALLEQAENQLTRSELETLRLFCDGWAGMKEAEAAASPESYAAAAETFVKAEKAATGKKFRLLALADASVCRALQHGTEFRRTRNTQLYSEIKRQLETARDYYQQAKLQNAADWTTATAKLFDALVYMADAASEKESGKKTELYKLAEKHFQLAAKLYDRAGSTMKSDEALRHLETAKQEKELLLAPVEALVENQAIAGVVVAPVSLIRDQASGIERFEGAQVVGNMSIVQKEVGVGSELMLELEVANVGKTAATLMKLENIAPEGLEIDKQGITARVEDNYVDLRGKRLEYLKTHEVKISLKGKRKGMFEVRPRILFVDEKGTYRSYEFEPASVTVKELGISGWLKGPK